MLSLAAGALMIGVGMTVAVLPQRVYAVSGTLEGVSLIASVFALAYLLAQVPVGMLADRFGAKPFLAAGFVACGLAGLIFWAADGAAGIYLGRVLQGIGEAPVWALGPAVLALAHPDSKGRAFGIYNAAIHAGLTAGPLLGLALVPDGTGGAPFMVFAALCFAGGGIVLALLPRSPEPIRLSQPRAGVRGLLRLLARRRVLCILSGIALYGACYGVFVSVLPVSLGLSHDFDASATGLLFAAIYGALSLSQLLAGPLADRFGRTAFMVAGLGLAASGLGSFSWMPGLWALAPLGLAGFGLGLFCVASLAALNDDAPIGLNGAVSGGYYLAWGLGYVLGPLAIGAMEQGYGLLTGALALQAIIMLYHLRRAAIRPLRHSRTRSAGGR